MRLCAIDSDIIVNFRFIYRLSGLDKNALVVTEEALLGRTDQRGRADDNNNALRARLWGFRVGRRVPFVLNSAVLRVTPRHTPLLHRWRSLLEFASLPRGASKGMGQPRRAYGRRSRRSDGASLQ